MQILSEVFQGNPLAGSQTILRFPDHFRAHFPPVSAQNFHQCISVKSSSLFIQWAQREVWIKPGKYENTPAKFWSKCPFTYIWVLLRPISEQKRRILCLGIGSRPSKWQSPVSLLCSYIWNPELASGNSSVSRHMLISPALCSHLWTFIFQPRCFIWFSFPSDYFYLSLCLSEVIHIFSMRISHCYSMPILYPL